MLLQIYSLSMLRILSGLLNRNSNISPERSILRFSLILFLYMCFYLILLFYKWLFHTAASGIAETESTSCSVCFCVSL